MFFYSTFGLVRETIKSNIKPKPSTGKYPFTPVGSKYHFWMLILKRTVFLHDNDMLQYAS